MSKSGSCRDPRANFQERSWEDFGRNRGRVVEGQTTPTNHRSSSTKQVFGAAPIPEPSPMFRPPTKPIHPKQKRKRRSANSSSDAHAPLTRPSCAEDKPFRQDAPGHEIQRARLLLSFHLSSQNRHTPSSTCHLNAASVGNDHFPWSSHDAAFRCYT
jgi:hypothetical protein